MSLNIVTTVHGQHVLGAAVIIRQADYAAWTMLVPHATLLAPECTSLVVVPL